ALFDTIAKIGLGAFISGLAGYLIAKASHRHDFRKEVFRRRMDRLESIALAVEAHYHVFHELWATYRGQHALWAEQKRSHPVAEELATLTSIAVKVQGTAGKVLDSEGYAHLLGEAALAKKLEDFRAAFAEFQKPFLRTSAFPSPKELVRLAEAVEAYRNEIFKILAREFKRPA